MVLAPVHPLLCVGNGRTLVIEPAQEVIQLCVTLASCVYGQLSDKPLTLIERDGWSENRDERSWIIVKTLDTGVPMASSAPSFAEAAFSPKHPASRRQLIT